MSEDMGLLLIGFLEGVGLTLIAYLAHTDMKRWWREGPGYFLTRVRGRRKLRQLRAAYEPPRMSDVVRSFTEEELEMAFVREVDEFARTLEELPERPVLRPIGVDRVTQTVELPAGCSHHSTTVFAQSWAAYDALGYEDGWKESTLFNTRTGRPFSFKQGEIRVHAPDGPRVCPDCQGEGKHNPSRDPQREVDCPTCRGDGELIPVTAGEDEAFAARHDSHLAI